jgi:DNA-binding transcriptional MerR regulator
MYSIGQIANLTGITTYTIRYYENEGVLPKPNRVSGVRRYNEQDLQYIRFIHSLKQTGMRLEDIAAFTEDGCLLTRKDPDEEISETLSKRINILDQHIDHLAEQIKQLEAVKANANAKRTYYSDKLESMISN